MDKQDFVEVLAHLDFLVGGPKLWSLQDADAEQQMYRVLVKLADRLGNRFTVDQIKTCLWREYERGETYADYNFACVFLHGSSEMRELGQETKKLVRNRLSQIYTDPQYEISRRKQPRLLFKPPETVFKRKSRSSATRRRRSTRSTTSSHSTIVVQRNQPARGCLSSEAENPSTSQSRRYQTRSTSIITTIEGTRASNLSLDTANSIISPINSSPLSSAPSSPWPSPDCSTSMDQHKDCWENHEETRRYTPINSSCSDLLAELSYYKRCYTEADRERSDLEGEYQRMERLCEVAKGNPEKILKKLRAMTRQISISKRQLDEQMMLEPYLTVHNTTGEVPTTPRLSSTFQAMRQQLTSIMGLGRANRPSIRSLYNHSKDLDVLLDTVFGGHNPNLVIEPLNISPALLPDEIIKALTGAAIHRWVFENDYTCPIMVITPLLQKYRDHIATLFGNERLYDLDTAAHQSIIEEKSFRDVTIPRMASKLSDRLLDALQPLLNQQLHHKKIEKLRILLDSILTSAIQIRSLSLVGSEVYESIWPSSGSSFDSTLMEEESPVQKNKIDSIRVALSPGLRAYRKDQGMILYDGFKDHKETSMTPQYTIKALILA